MTEVLTEYQRVGSRRTQESSRGSYHRWESKPGKLCRESEGSGKFVLDIMEQKEV